MEVILDELRENGVDINMRTLSHHVNYFLERHRVMYNQMPVNVNPDEMHVVFSAINVTNFGCAIAYLIAAFGCNPFEKL